MTAFLTVHALVGAVALSMAIPASAQEDAAPDKAQEAATIAWPELTSAQESALAGHCKMLRRTVKEERIAEIELSLVEMGAGATPHLISRMSDHRKNINDSISLVLDQITTAEHAPLLAEFAQDRKTAVRSYVVRRLTEFCTPEMADVFRRAREDKDEGIAFQAALGLASAGDGSAIGVIFDHCMDDWLTDAARVSAALEPCRSPDTAQWVLRRMEGTDERAVVTGLRLLRSVGTVDKAALIGRFLQHESQTVKKEAINALRVVVDGDEPLEKLPVFKTIEMAKQWRSRVG